MHMHAFVGHFSHLNAGRCSMQPNLLPTTAACLQLLSGYLPFDDPRNPNAPALSGARQNTPVMSSWHVNTATCSAALTTRAACHETNVGEAQAFQGWWPANHCHNHCQPLPLPLN